LVVDELVNELAAGTAEARILLRGFKEGFTMNALFRHAEELNGEAGEGKKKSGVSGQAKIRPNNLDKR
jgi:hypothetical protein